MNGKFWGDGREEEIWESDTLKLFINSWAYLKLSCLGLILTGIQKTLRTERTDPFSGARLNHWVMLMGWIQIAAQRL